jgi:hypothetical protein
VALMSVELYTPQKVQPFGTVKNSDVNMNLALIQDAFNAMSAFTPTQSATAIGADKVRNILVDLSSVATAGYMTVTLPDSPTVGDPPVTVAVVESGYSALVNGLSSVIVTTADGNTIMGVTPAGSYDGLPFLTNAGDSIKFVFIGGPYGWVIQEANLSVYATPTAIATLQQWDSSNLHCFHGLDSVIDTSAITNTTLSLAGINAPGLSCSFTIANGAGPQAILTSSGSQTFNGTTGVFTIPASPVDVRYRFTCISTNHFAVTH